MDNFKGQVTRKIPAHILRMEEEMKELVTRLEALFSFIDVDNPIYMGLSTMQKDLLSIQCDAMTAYNKILHVRIENEYNILEASSKE